MGIRKNGILLVVIIAFVVIFLSIGYAMISDVTLSVSGSATVPKLEDFSVRFDRVEEISTTTNDILVDASVIDDTHADFTVSGLVGYGDTATIRYTIMNESTISNASFTVTTTNSNNEYFSVTPSITNYSSTEDIVKLAPGETAYLTVKVKVKKVSIDDRKTANINISINAKQVVD